MRRYVQFAFFALAVCAMVVAGLALQGAAALPKPEEMAGLDGFTALIYQAGAYAKTLSGAPYFLARFFSAPGTFHDGRVHEYGTTLLTMAGILNVLAISSALDLRKVRQ
jgi:hypothetical protein